MIAVRESRRVLPRRRGAVVGQHFGYTNRVHTGAKGGPHVGPLTDAAKAVNTGHFVDAVVRSSERRGSTGRKKRRGRRGLGGLSGA